MNTQSVSTVIDEAVQTAQFAITDTNTYIQLLVIVVVYILSFAAAYKIRHSIGLTHNEPLESAHPVRKLVFRIGGILFPLLAIILLQISTKAGESLAFTSWLIETALAIAVLLFFNSLIRAFVQHKFTYIIAAFIRRINNGH